jgi:hypothetical protein
MMSEQHTTKIVRHDVQSCNTSRHAPSGVCGTVYELRCSCGFGQGARCHEHAEAIERGHHEKPGAEVVHWDPEPLTADTITDTDLRALFARHCECRPLNLSRESGDHAAIHDCDTAILHDVQIALGALLFNDIGRIQAIDQARGRCAEFINEQRKGR